MNTFKKCKIEDCASCAFKFNDCPFAPQERRREVSEAEYQCWLRFHNLSDVKLVN